MNQPRPGAEPVRVRTSVPDATVARLPLYLRVLGGLAERRVTTVSSDTLAIAAGVTSAKVRKDLSHLGSYGTRGVGYDVDLLMECISTELGLSEDRSVILVGVGNLGHALAGYGGFRSRGFRIVALADADVRRIGEKIGDVEVRPVDELEALIKEKRVTIGVISTPAAAAQEICDRLVAAGVTSVLNFAPTVLAVPPGVHVRKVDLAVELQILSFHEARKNGGEPRLDRAALVRDRDRDQDRDRSGGEGVEAARMVVVPGPVATPAPAPAGPGAPGTGTGAATDADRLEAIGGEAS